MQILDDIDMSKGRMVSILLELRSMLDELEDVIIKTDCTTKINLRNLMSKDSISMP